MSEEETTHKPKYISRWRGPASIRKTRKPKLKKKRKVSPQTIRSGITKIFHNLLQLLPWFRKDELEEREIIVGDKQHNKTFKFASNSISTTKYSPITFLPKNLIEQFKRLANIWFLIVAAIQLIPGISPLNPASSIVPLAFVLGVTALKEAIEDIKRRVTDMKVNNQKAYVLSTQDGSAKWVKTSWRSIVVGDIIKLVKNDTIPADLVLLSSSEVEGLAYVETANLDGETNLKVKQALEETNIFKPDSLDELYSYKPSIKYQRPNVDLYTFEGAFSNGEESDLPLKVDQTMWRGTQLRNTRWIIGVVIYTGMESKIMKNARKPPSKRTNLEIQMNKCLLQIFIFALVLDFLGGLLAGIWATAFGDDFWFLSLDDSPAYIGLITFPAWLILLNVIIPISLYVYMEMVKVVMVFWISWDRSMYDEKTDTPAKANTSNLSEELGQIEYIFSDKTGTLTQNCMEFKRISVGGVAYGSSVHGVSDKDHKKKVNDILARTESMNSVKGGIEVEAPLPPDDYIFSDPELQKQFNKQDDSAMEFFRILAVCHTVIVQAEEDEEEEDEDEKKKKGKEKEKENDGEPNYQATSPDEEALVKAARKLGFEFVSRQQGSVEINVFGKKEIWPILNVLEFNSDRKRMSVVTRDPNTNEIKLFCKGADNMIFARLADDQDDLKNITLGHLGEFAAEGLRTLGVARKILNSSEYKAWNKKYYDASVKINGREEAMDAVAEEIETDLELIGATAIEDKLQEGVPEAIATLLRAGIKMWVLTGDKMETAINIGFSCCLLNSEMRQIVFSSTPLDPSHPEAKGYIPITSENAAEELEKKIARWFPEIADLTYHTSNVNGNDGYEMENLDKNNNNNFNNSKKNKRKTSNSSLDSSDDNSNSDESSSEEQSYLNKSHSSSSMESQRPKNIQYAAIVDGKALSYYIKTNGFDGLALRFLELFMRCKVVICCRVSPLQKALVVRLVKQLLGAITLSIGDGANDVPMIQEAQIGVGISGKEGTQAVMNGDYAIAQFRFLTRLLLVHGSWSYHRMCLLLLYSFYKNIVFSLPNFWFGIFSAFSAQTLFDSWAVSVYNILFTGLPILMVAIFDQNVRAQEMYDYPELYTRGIQGKDFHRGRFWTWQGLGIIQSLVITYFGFFSVWDGTIASNGWTHGLFSMGATVLTGVILVVNLKIFLITNTWTVFNHFGLYFSVFLWYVFLLIYTLIPKNIVIDPNDLFWVTYNLMATANFWLYSLCVVVICFVPDFAYKYYRRSYKPQDYHIIQEKRMLQDRGSRRRKYIKKVRKNMLLRPLIARKKHKQKQLDKDEGESVSPDFTGYAFSQTEGQRDLLISLGMAHAPGEGHLHDMGDDHDDVKPDKKKRKKTKRKEKVEKEEKKEKKEKKEKVEASDYSNYYSDDSSEEGNVRF